MSISFVEALVNTAENDRIIVSAAGVVEQRNASLRQKTARARDIVKRHIAEINDKVLTLISDHKERSIIQELPFEDEEVVHDLAEGLAASCKDSGWIAKIHRCDTGPGVSAYIVCYLPNGAITTLS